MFAYISLKLYTRVPTPLSHFQLSLYTSTCRRCGGKHAWNPIISFDIPLSNVTTII